MVYCCLNHFGTVKVCTWDGRWIPMIDSGAYVLLQCIFLSKGLKIILRCRYTWCLEPCLAATAVDACLWKCVVLQSCTTLVWIVFHHCHPSQRQISVCWVWLAAVNYVKYGVCHCYQQTFYSHCIVQSVLFSVTDWIVLVKVLSWPYPRREQVFGMWYMTAAVSLKCNILVLINSFQLAVFIVIWRHVQQATAALVQLQQFIVLPFSSIWQLRYR